MLNTFLGRWVGLIWCVTATKRHWYWISDMLLSFYIMRAVWRQQSGDGITKGEIMDQAVQIYNWKDTKGLLLKWWATLLLYTSMTQKWTHIILQITSRCCKSNGKYQYVPSLQFKCMSLRIIYSLNWNFQVSWLSLKLCPKCKCT
jgi:hypothetical protein